MGTGIPEPKDRGIALVLVMTVVLALAIIATPFVLSMLLQERSGTHLRYESQADYGAEGAKNYALWRLMFSLDPVERRYGVGIFSSYYWDTQQEFDVRLTDQYLSQNAKVQDPKGAIWGLTVQDEQGKLNVRTAPMRAVLNLQQMVDDRAVSLKDYLTIYSGRDASWICPQRIRGMGNAIPAQQNWYSQNGLFLDHPQAFGPEARVRVTKPGLQPLEAKVTATWVLGQTSNGLETNPAIPASYADGIIEVECRHPININTARRETIIAMFEGLHLWDPKSGSVVPDSLVGRGDAVRIANAFYGREVRRLEQFGLALVQLNLTASQIVAIALNAVCPTAALLDGTGTVPLCFKSYDVYTIEALSSVNNPAGAEVAERGFREVVSVAAPAVLNRYVESQLDFDLMLFPLAIAAPQYMGTFTSGGYPFGGRVASFPNMLPTQLPVTRPSGAPIGPSDVTLKPQQVKGPGGNEAYVQLYAARDFRGWSNLEQQLLNWPNKDPRDHFDDSQEGKRLQGSAHIYPWGQVLTYNYDQNNPPPPQGQTADIAGGGFEVWARFDKIANPMQIFDIREKDYENRLTLRVENGELILTASDSVIGDSNDGDPLNNGAAEIRQPFTPAADTWYHFGAYWKSNRYAQLALLVDGFAHPQQKFNHVSPEGTKIMTTLGQALAQNASSITLKDDSWLPNYLTPLLIGSEIVLYDKSSTTLLRGARGTQAQTHPPGATVSIWGYSSKVRTASVTADFGQIQIAIPYDRIYKTNATLKYSFGMNPQATVTGEKQDPMTMQWSLQPTDTTIGVLTPNITDYPDQGYITIDQEVIFYTGRSVGGTGKGMPPSSAKFTGCVRGQQGTSSVQHNSGAQVRMWSLPVTNTTGFCQPGQPAIVQIGDEWFGPVWRDMTRANFWIVMLNNGAPLPLHRGNGVFGSIPQTHNAGDKVLPTFLAKESDPNMPGNLLSMGRNDFVTVVDASNAKERARVRTAGPPPPPPPGQPQTWPGNYSIQGGGQIAAFDSEVTRDYVADMLYVRVLKFPSGELIGLQWLTAANPNFTIGPADLTIDEVKCFASLKIPFLMGQQAGNTDATLNVLNATGGQRGGLLKVGDEYVGYANSGNAVVTGCKRGWLCSNQQLHDLGDPIFELGFVPVGTLANDVTATDPNLVLNQALPGHPNRYRKGYVLIDNEVLGFEWNGGNGQNLGMPVKFDGTTGLYRGMFGTQPAAHQANSSLVYGIPWRYYDTYKPQEFDDTMAYFQWSTKMDLANWRTLTWMTDPAFKDPNVVLHCLVRFDGKGEFFDRPEISDRVLLMELQNSSNNRLNRVGHKYDAGQLDVRFYVEYKPNSFDPTQPWNVHSWKRTPKITEIRVEYDRPIQTLYHEDR